VDVCYRLWEDSWDDDAVVRDADRRVFTDPDGVDAVGFEGEYFDVPGPHGCEPSPQRTPVLFQAGASDRGRNFAGTHAEAVFCSYPTEAGVAEYVDDLRSRVEAAGRDPDSVAFFPGIVPVVGETEAVAEAKYESYRENVDVEAVLTLLSGFFGMDLSELDADEAVEHIDTEAIQGAVDAFTSADPDREWTVREVAQFAGLGSTSPVVVGTPDRVADELERWYTDLGVDGFNVKEVVRTGSLDDFVDLVVPELRDRGLVRESYEGTTLRENLLGRSGLPEGHPGA